MADPSTDGQSTGRVTGTTVADGAIGIRLIVVGLDGSAESMRAADLAVVIAETFAAEVVAVHATGLLDVWPAVSDVPPKRNSHARVRKLMETVWSEPLKHRHVRWRLELRDGPPADTMLTFATEQNADLIVVGSRGSGDSAAGALGSTSVKLVERSHIPVLVVPNRT